MVAYNVMFYSKCSFAHFTHRTSVWVVTFLIICGLLSTNLAGQPVSSYKSVTDERLENPEPHNWLMYRGNYDSSGYSPLSQIDTTNVSHLAPVWTFSTGMRESHQAPPIVNEGIMFVTTPHNHVLALDARSGDLLWRYARDLPEAQYQMHPTNRGVAVYANYV